MTIEQTQSFQNECSVGHGVTIAHIENMSNFEIRQLLDALDSSRLILHDLEAQRIQEASRLLAEKKARLKREHRAQMSGAGRE